MSKNTNNLVTELFHTELEFLDDLKPLFLIFTQLNWRYIWYYRFLRISPSYNYFLSLVDSYLDKKNIKKNKKIKNYYNEINLRELSKFGEKKFQKNIPSLFETYKANGDLRVISLIEWWYSSAIHSFNIHSFPSVNVIAYTKPETSLHKDHIKVVNKKITSILSYKSNSPKLILSVDINLEKEKILKEIDKTISEHAKPIQPNTFAGTLKILQSKSHEKKYKDCYQALYFRYKYPDLSLEELAVKANVLNFSQLGLNNGSRSVQSGVSRLLRNAVNIAENVAYGIFPSDSSKRIFRPISYNKEFLNQKIFDDVKKQVEYDISYFDKLPDYYDVMVNQWQIEVI